MLEVLKPPTDNLYKFAAISGTLLMFLCLYLSVTLVSQHQLKVRALGETLVVLQVAREQLDDPGLAVDSRKTAGRGYAADEKRFQAEYVWLKSEKELVEWYLIFLGVGIGIGFWVAGWGYRRWYIHVQRPEDERIAAALRRAQSTEQPEANSTTTSSCPAGK